ncbi:unnamed protein product [Soboliphyme baturini]|uniref:Integrase n=1 Tax=Soboliphyme baturini TaxID=241478 RepID=A0A183J7F2_9BILA|nr:unnamed protein product [Soboliphyme baturini]
MARNDFGQLYGFLVLQRRYLRGQRKQDKVVRLHARLPRFQMPIRLACLWAFEDCLQWSSDKRSFLASSHPRLMRSKLTQRSDLSGDATPSQYAHAVGHMAAQAESTTDRVTAVRVLGGYSSGRGLAPRN